MKRGFLVMANGRRLGRIFATRDELRAAAAALGRAVSFDRDCATLL